MARCRLQRFGARGEDSPYGALSDSCGGHLQVECPGRGAHRELGAESEEARDAMAELGVPPIGAVLWKVWRHSETGHLNGIYLVKPEAQYTTVCQKAGIPLLLETSVKKALDRNWSDKQQKAEAVDVLAQQVLSLERWIARHLAEMVDGTPDDVCVVLRQLMEQGL
ncbi:MAG: hypothetical protein GY811_10825 [Myxococcales bacterium]|nr:hypothetical protein [Myxococcales bacterium]